MRIPRYHHVAYLGQHQCRVKMYTLFSVFILKTHMYYIFNIYMYYKRNTSGLSLRPSPMLLENAFKSARDILKEIDPLTDFLHM